MVEDAIIQTAVQNSRFYPKGMNERTLHDFNFWILKGRTEVRGTKLKGNEMEQPEEQKAFWKPAGHLKTHHIKHTTNLNSPKTRKATTKVSELTRIMELHAWGKTRIYLSHYLSFARQRCAAYLELPQSKGSSNIPIVQQYSFPKDTASEKPEPQQRKQSKMFALMFSKEKIREEHIKALFLGVKNEKYPKC